MNPHPSIHFLRRGQPVVVHQVAPDRTLLQLLREDLGSTGTKEGCGEGDCGACTVVLGERLQAPDGSWRLGLRAINSCIRLAHSVNGMALWTVEDLAADPLLQSAASANDSESATPNASACAAPACHPAQQALVDCHASQCGFCTPGFVMSLFAMYHNQGRQNPVELQEGQALAVGTLNRSITRPVTRHTALQDLAGNLCRCTGYRPILDAAQAMGSYPQVRINSAELLPKIEQLMQAEQPHAGISSYQMPTTLAAALAARAAQPQAQLVAGCTDVALWVNKQHRHLSQVLDLTRVAELRELALVPGDAALAEHQHGPAPTGHSSGECNGDRPHPHPYPNSGGHLVIGAAVTLADAFDALVAQWPQLHDFAARFAGLTVRNSGTLGGNIANGSPIGDSMPLLIALKARVVLASVRGERAMPLENLYTGYRKNAMAADEILVRVVVPLGQPSDLLRAYKISKRHDDDISAVSLVLLITLADGAVQHASIGVGGVAATPVRARRTEEALRGRPWSLASLQRAAAVLQAECAPISDMRASAAYRSHVLGSLLERFWHENQPKPLAALRDLLPLEATGSAVPVAGSAAAASVTSTLTSIAAPPSTGSSGTPQPHESARAQVAGNAAYVDDMPELRGSLHAAPIMSPVAHGWLRGVDASAALAMPGVRGVVLATDIPGDPVLAAFARDEPVFAADKVHYLGQVIGLVLADSVMQARRAARAVALDIAPLPAVITVQEALQQRNYVLPPVHLQRGDAAAALARAPHTLTGAFECGGQEHFYLEGQVAYAVPQEQNGWAIYASTQHPGEVQHWVAHALGIASHAVRVECRRMGGAFGGKETQAGHVAVWAAVAAHKLGRPVKLRLDRDDDFLITGKRHPFAYRYTAGFDDTGLLCGLQLRMAVNCGFSADLSGPVADRAVFHCDNGYYLQDVAIESLRCKTNTQSHTAFRGFGGPQGMLAIEVILSDIARALGHDPLDVRLRNLYSDAVAGPPPAGLRNTTHYGMAVEDNILQPLLAQLEASAQYRNRRQAIALWNTTSPVFKRGIAITPVKFGISFTATVFNQAGALVHVYTDGSVLVAHGGTEMGQGLHTKVAQTVADELGVPLARVRSSASDTAVVPNASATAASAGTDLNARAAQYAARAVRNNLAQCLASLDGCTASAVHFANGQVTSLGGTRSFADVVRLAYANRVQLWSDGFYRTPKIHYDKTTLTGRPFYYFAYGAACTEVVVDTLTGESRVLAVDVLHDVGRSINPAIDKGQIEGGFVQGMGWLTTEQLVWTATGQLATHAPSTYKIPTASDVPAHFKVDLWHQPNREDNVFGSKAVGEPPLMLAISVFEALREAVAAALQVEAADVAVDAVAGGEMQPAVVLQAPATAENLLRALGKIGQP